jgi:hypothetical protein
MPIKLTCPHCGTVHRFGTPYPVAGAEVHCGCGRVLVLSYPADLLSRILAEGATLAEPEPSGDEPGRFYRPEPTLPASEVQARGGGLPPRTRGPGSGAPEGHR